MYKYVYIYLFLKSTEYKIETLFTKNLVKRKLILLLIKIINKEYISLS